jgi:hypothetical protein
LWRKEIAFGGVLLVEIWSFLGLMDELVKRLMIIVVGKVLGQVGRGFWVCEICAGGW